MRYALVLTLLFLAACPAPEICDEDGDGWDCEEDCDDANPDTFPGAPEQCDGEDNDCDGNVPNGPGVGMEPGEPDESDLDGDGWPACDDCDPTHPKAVGPLSDCP